MIAKINRFHGHQTVRRVYRQGRPVRGSLMSLHVFKDPKHPRTKVAVVVSKKVDKSAVKRNRIRRRIYEVIRSDLGNLKQPCEMVFTVYKTETATTPPPLLAAEIQDLLQKAKLL